MAFMLYLKKKSVRCFNFVGKWCTGFPVTEEQRHFAKNATSVCFWIYYSHLKHIIEGKIERTRRRVRKRKQLLDERHETREYWNLKEGPQDGTLHRNDFGRVCGLLVKGKYTMTG